MCCKIEVLFFNKTLHFTSSHIHLFILSRLDYCNALYYGISQSCLKRLQVVQNDAARLLTGRRRFDHATPILIFLNWLPVKYRIIFKVLTFVFKSLHNLAPSYITEVCLNYNPTRALRSCSSGLLIVPRTRLQHRGDRAFAVAGPNLWNNLPDSIRTVSSLSYFKHLLKEHLFSVVFNEA